MSNTLVLKLSPKEQASLKASLERGTFDHRSVPYAAFSVKGEGVTATQYKSGKLVVQGKGTEMFVARYLDKQVPAAPKPSPKLGPVDTYVTGSDETGKGDYFGPLVVVAVRVSPEDRAKLEDSPVTDSKKLTDEACARMAPALMDRFEHAIARLDPPEYNVVHAREKNLNPMLADLHAQALREIVQDGDRVVVDRFANEKLVASRMKGLDIELIQTPRAESLEPAVAAASVIARHTFVEALAELSASYAVELRKGAGSPTDKAARAFVKLHGFDELENVAKLHFKNTQKI